jgi:hypothetical protein
MSLMQELAAVLPDQDRAAAFAGDRLSIVPPAKLPGVVEKYLRSHPQQLESLAAATKKKGEIQSLEGSETTLRRISLKALCRSWLSGDSVALLRHRDGSPLRVAVLERTSPSTLWGKMYFGPVHNAWSSTDQAFYDVGIRRVEAYFVGRRGAALLTELPGHSLSAGKLSIDLEAFRASSLG